MITVENFQGHPLHIRVDQIAAYGRIDDVYRPHMCSFVQIVGLPHPWESRTSYLDLHQMISHNTED